MAREAVMLRNSHLCQLAEHDKSVGLNLRTPKDRMFLLLGKGFAVLDDGEVFGAAGIVPIWAGCGQGWAILPQPTGSGRLLWLTREVQAYLDKLEGWRRVQTTVPADFPAGLAWACHLGFKPEGRMTAYDELGQDHIMFARIYR